MEAKHAPWLARWLRGAALSAVIAFPAAAVAEDPPSLAEAVAAGELPPLAERLPVEPLVVNMAATGRQTGQYGGALRTMVRNPSDTKLLVVYGYARLVGYDRDLQLRPDILRDITVDEGRIFTFKLREGHRWSDGHPFTAEDFRYFWEDVANNEELSPGGPPSAMLVEGEAPLFEVLDDYTVRYTWSRPNPFFLPRIAGAYPLFVYRPAHYLKQFHGGYADPEALERLSEEEVVESWAALHERFGNMYRLDNPDLPTLQAWRLGNRPPAKRFRAPRNPYFHRVDEEGRQLPYLDEVVLLVTSNSLIPAKTTTGESDLQARGLSFNDMAMLRDQEGEADYATLLWSQGIGSQMALYPNFNVNDPAWREVLRDSRFRRALSLAIDRDTINAVLYYGLARPSANTVLPSSPLFRPEFAEASATFDLEGANRLLDKMGLTERTDQGIRLLPDGRPLDLIVETAGESSEQTDILELIKSTWAEVGVKLLPKPSQRDVVRGRIASGETVMSVWTGLSKGIATAQTTPEELVPDHRFNPQWPKWGAYEQTDGQAGEPVDLPEVQKLLDLQAQWTEATDDTERADLWLEMLAIHAQQVFTIGTVASVPQPIVVSRGLMNVPEEGIFAWYPGANFGLYEPDSFWLQP